MRSSLLRRIVSGGQTGVDRGALDAAIELGMEHGGKCPRGRLAEDGCIPDRYDLEETDSSRYWIRTEHNVIESDATLIFCWKEPSGGTEFTRRMAIKHGRPYLLFDFTNPPELEDVQSWLERERVEVLNCAGPRESSCPGIASLTRLQIIEIVRATLSDATVTKP